MFNLVCAFVLVLFVSTTTGVNWIGTFAANTTCNNTVCCCPKSGLTFTNTSGEIASISDAVGTCKTASAKVKIDPTNNIANIANYGNFTLANDDDTIEVTLALNDGNLAPACKITMYRVGSTGPATGSTPIATTDPTAGPGASPATGPPAAPGASPATGPPAAPGANPSTGPPGNKPQSNQNPGSDAVSNYGSIWLKFLSSIMAALLFGCI